MKVYRFFYHSIGKAYLDTFRGLSKEVWWLSLITLINRAGTMVIPFLSLYLTTDLHFSLDDVAWIMTAFGIGSLVGSWVGGKLTDKIGFYKVMVLSLVLSGLLFFGMQYLETFQSVCFGIFVLMAVADMFRPAMFVALNAYSKPENKTRSITLIRLAINLGFSAGPAIGGFIITTLTYHWLFWIDGISCITAGIVLLNILHPKKSVTIDAEVNPSPQSAYKDKSFLIFLIAMVIFGVIFLQFISTIPYFYKESVGLSEFEIGLLMALNGILIFIFEMPLIKWLEQRLYSKINLMLFGMLITVVSFLFLIIYPWLGFVIVSMVFLTLGEMIVFPFSNSFSLDRAKRGLKGEYMALYSIAFSISHIFAHNLGFHLINAYGFTFTWSIMAILGMLGLLFLFYLKNHLLPNNQRT